MNLHPDSREEDFEHYLLGEGKSVARVGAGVLKDDALKEQQNNERKKQLLVLVEEGFDILLSISVLLIGAAAQHEEDFLSTPCCQ